MFCKNCGSSIDDKAEICPKCGVRTGDAARQNGAKNNTIAIVGFILSFFIAIAGLICSIIGYKKATNEGADYKNLALAGIIISIVSMVLSVILMIYVNSLTSDLLAYYSLSIY